MVRGVVGAPHQLLHAHKRRSLLDGKHRAAERVELVIEQPCDAARLDAHLLMARQLYLLLPLRAGHHAEMSDGNPQTRAFGNDFFHLAHLYGPIGHVYGEKHVVFFHQVEHPHHFVGGQVHPAFRQQQPLRRNFYRLKAPLHEFFRMRIETGLAGIDHAATQKAVGGTYAAPLPGSRSADRRYTPA